MDDSREKEPKGLTRRAVLKSTGLAAAMLGGLAAGGTLSETRAVGDCNCPDGPTCTWTNNANRTQQYSYFEALDPFNPFAGNTSTTIRQLGTNEMRITFMGSCIPPVRRAQQMMSVFVEVGWDATTQRPLDQFVFDCGAGVSANYGAMNVGFGRMDKIFITHLHGDHMSDLTHIYCFGPSGDRKTPLYVWGPSRSTVESPPGSGTYYNDGTEEFCRNLRRACRWHTESFGFETTAYTGYMTQEDVQQKWGLKDKPVPVDQDPWGDGFAMVPVELNWRLFGKEAEDNVAYHNTETGVKITHFPVIHTRKGSIGYKLEWTTPNGKVLSMIYTGDTKPEVRSVDAAINDGNGVDVFIHEMVVPAQVWAMKMDRSTELPPFDDPTVEQLTTVQNSSHSPQGAFGFLMTQIDPKPRLTVATHFPVANDTVGCALKSVQEHWPEAELGKNIVWSFDLMVIKVNPSEIKVLRGTPSDYGFSPTWNGPLTGSPVTPKYADSEGNGDPYAQISQVTEIPSCGKNTCNYRDDGY